MVPPSTTSTRPRVIEQMIPVEFELFSAAQMLNFPNLQRIVQEDFMRRNPGWTIVDVLLRVQTQKKQTVLHEACSCSLTGANGEDILEQILEWILQEPLLEDIDKIRKLLRSEDSDGMTPLMTAARFGRGGEGERRARAIFQADQHIHAACEEDSLRTPLGMARCKTGATALHYAASSTSASPSFMKLLIDEAPEALHVFAHTGGTPLHWALVPVQTGFDFATNHLMDKKEVQTRHHATIQALLDHGADIHAHQGDEVPPPLIMAMVKRNDRLALFLLLQKQQNLQPSIDFVIQPGSLTTLHLAAQRNLPGTLSVLIRYHARIPHAENLESDAQPQSDIYSQMNDWGCTALSLAAEGHHVECVRLLLNATSKWNVIYNKKEAEKYMKTMTENEMKALLSTRNKQGSRWSNEEENSNGIDFIEKMATRHANQLLMKLESRANTESAYTDQADSEEAQKYKTKGNQYFANQQWDDAEKRYTEAILTHPYDGTFYSNRSACYMELKNYKDALYDAVLAQNIQPKWPKAWYRIAVARLALQHHAAAALAVKKGLLLDPDNVEFKNLLEKCGEKKD